MNARCSSGFYASGRKNLAPLRSMVYDLSRAECYRDRNSVPVQLAVVITSQEASAGSLERVADGELKL